MVVLLRRVAILHSYQHLLSTVETGISLAKAYLKCLHALRWLLLTLSGLLSGGCEFDGLYGSATNVRVA